MEGGRDGVRRRDGGAWRPGRGVPAGEGPDGAEAAHRAVPPQRQAGDRGDPDDGVDDHQLPSRPAPRRPTWPTRSWTARTRSCSRPSPRSGAYPIETVKTMSKIVEAAEEELLVQGPAAARARARSRVRRAVRWPARPARSRTSWTARRWSPSPSPATRPAGSPATARAQPILAFTTEPEHPQPAHAELGRGDLRRAARRATPTRWSTWSTRSC